MKKIVAALIVLALLVTGAYAGFGLLARQGVVAGVDVIQKQLPGIVDKDVKGGLLSSEVTIRIPLPVSGVDDPDAEATLVVTETIYHGPVVFTGQAHGIPRTFARAYGVGTLALEMPGVDIPTKVQELLSADLTIVVPLVGATQVNLAGKPLQHTITPVEGSPVSVDWQGFELDMAFPDNSLLSYSLDLQASGLQVAVVNTGDQFSLRGLGATGTMTEGEHALSLGSISCSLEEMEARLVGQDDHVLLQGMSAKLSSSEEAGMIHVVEDMALAGLTFDNKKYENFILRVAMRNLVAQTVVDVTQALQEMEADPAVQNDPQLAQQHLMAIVTTHGPALLAGSPELAIEEFSASTPQGKVEMTGSIRFNGEGEVLLNPIFLVGRLGVEGSFKAESEALEQLMKENVKMVSCADPNDMSCDQQALDMARAQLGELVAGDVLVRTNSGYSYTMSFKDGQILVNGKPQPFPLPGFGS